MASLYIAPGNAQPGRHLPLGLAAHAVQSVAAGEHLPLAGGEFFLQQAVELLHFHLAVQLVDEVVILAHHIHQGEGIAVLVDVDRVGDADILQGFSAAAEVHEDFILDAAGGVGGKFGALGVIKGGGCFDQAHGADGDQILLVRAAGSVIFFDDMGHQAQVVLDQPVAGGLVPLGYGL